MRKELLEQQKQIAMLEVHAVTFAKMKELEDRRKAATEAAEAAKRNLAEQRLKEKEALEATRKALAESRALTKGVKGTKRTSEGGGEGPPDKKAAAADLD